MCSELINTIRNWNLNASGVVSTLDDFNSEGLTPTNVVVCDPITISHLFSNTDPLTAACEKAISVTQNSMIARDEKAFDLISRSVNAKVIEIVRFVVEGGQCVFFIRPEFFLHSCQSESTLDNYSWLDTLRPTASSTNKSSAIQPREVHALKLSTAGEASLFADYFRSLKSREILAIPVEDLIAGYEPLALAQNSAVAAGRLSLGGCGGAITFLPAPTSNEEFKAFKEALIALATDTLQNLHAISPPNTALSKLHNGESQDSEILKLPTPDLSKPSSIPNKTELPYQETLKELNFILDILLNKGPEELTFKLSELFSQGGWNVVESDDDNELFLGRPNREFLIARVASGFTTPLLKNLGELARKIITVWSEQGREPQGLLIYIARDCFDVDTKLKGLEYNVLDFARRNNIRLTTTFELASLLKQRLDGNLSTEQLCQELVYPPNDNEDNTTAEQQLQRNPQKR